MAPVNIAIIGLSQSAKTSWASEGHLPYLLSPRGQERYHIKALLNSSVDAAQRAIDFYKLPSGTKAYGSPHDLANDPDIDLVVNTTRVDVHFDSIKPSIEAGKNAFVEWPLAENVKRATELMELAKQKNVKTIVGLQARIAPAVLKVREILEKGDVGRVLSSRADAYSPYSGRDSISEGLGYFLDRKVGGNPITISFGHMIDFIHSVLGEYADSHAHVQIQHPQQSIINRRTDAGKPFTSDVPDLLSVHGTLEQSTYVVEGASLIANFRTGPPFPGTLPFIWTINCEKGEVRVSSERGPFLQSEASGFEIPIEVHDFGTDKVTRVDWGWEDWQKPLGARSKNIAKLYDLFAEGKLEQASCATFESAVQRHKQLDDILAGKVEQ